jgi:hypothetical protein
LLTLPKHLPGFILGTCALRKVGKGLGGNEQPYFGAATFVQYLSKEATRKAGGFGITP